MNTQEYALIESTIALNVPIIDYVSFSLFLHVMMIYVLSLGKPAHKLSSELNFWELQTFPHINASLVFQLLLSPHESQAQSVQAIVQVLLLLTFYVYVHLYLVCNRILESKLSARTENILLKLNDRFYTSPVDAMTILTSLLSFYFCQQETNYVVMHLVDLMEEIQECCLTAHVAACFCIPGYETLQALCSLTSSVILSFYMAMRLLHSIILHDS